MNYEDFIQNIIATRGQRNIPEGKYFEVHHIVPRCLGGEPKYYSRKSKHPNLIHLFPEEHYIAHKLLAEKYPENTKIVSAFWLMSNNPKTGQTISEQDYTLARELKQKAMQGSNNSFYGKKHTEETKAIIREKSRINGLGRPGTTNKAVICINTGVTYESATSAAKDIGTTCSAILESCRGARGVNRAKGYYFAFVDDLERQELFASYRGLPPSKADTEETRQKRSAAMKGIVWSDERNQKISLAKKGVKRNPESIEKMKRTKALNPRKMTNEEKARASANCKHKKKVLCTELNIIFDSVAAAARYVGVDKSRISHCINGQGKTVKGLHFKQMEETNELL